MINIFTHILDDDKDLLAFIARLLDKKKVKYKLFSDPELFLDAYGENVHLCVIDYTLTGYNTDGLEVMKKMLEKNRFCYVIVMSAQPDQAIVIDFINNGANRYIDKSKNNFIDELIKYVEDGVKYAEGLYYFIKRFVEGKVDAEPKIAG